MRVLVFSDVDDWDLGPRLTHAGHQIVGWVRNNWPNDRPRWGVYSKLASIASKVLSQNLPAEHIAPVFHTHTWLKSRGVPCLTCPNVNDPAFVDLVKKLDVDLIVVCVFPQILKSPVLRAPKMGAINCHPSLLPDYRGPQPTFWMLKNGESMAGISVHAMTERIDAGRIIARRPMPILDNENGGQLRQRLHHAAAEVLAKAIDDLATGSVSDDHTNYGDGSYFGRRRPEDAKFDWGEPAVQIVNLLRALQPSEPLMVRWKGHAIRIYRAHVTKASYCAAVPGQIVDKQPEKLVIRCGNGCLEVTRYEIGPLHGWINRVCQRFALPIGDRLDVEPGMCLVLGEGTSKSRKELTGTETRSSA